MTSKELLFTSLKSMRHTPPFSWWTRISAISMVGEELGETPDDVDEELAGKPDDVDEEPTFISYEELL
jgi:hypothetical protein